MDLGGRFGCHAFPRRQEPASPKWPVGEGRHAAVANENQHPDRPRSYRCASTKSADGLFAKKTSLRGLKYSVNVSPSSSIDPAGG